MHVFFVFWGINFKVSASYFGLIFLISLAIAGWRNFFEWKGWLLGNLGGSSALLKDLLAFQLFGNSHL